MVGSSGGGHLCLPELALPPLPIRGPSSPARTAGQPRRTQCLTAFRSPEETHLIWNLMEFSPSKPRPEMDLDSGSVVPGPTESMSCQNVTTSVRPGRAPAVPSPGWVVAGSYPCSGFGAWDSDRSNRTADRDAATEGKTTTS